MCRYVDEGDRSINTEANAMTHSCCRQGGHKAANVPNIQVSYTTMACPLHGCFTRDHLTTNWVEPFIPINYPFPHCPATRQWMSCRVPCGESPIATASLCCPGRTWVYSASPGSLELKTKTSFLTIATMRIRTCTYVKSASHVQSHQN